MADSDPVTYTPRLLAPVVPDGKRDWGQYWRAQQAELEYRLAGVTSGNPNGQQVGHYTGQMCWDSVGKMMYVCTTIGNAASAQWAPVSDQGTVPIARGGTGQTTAAGARAALEVRPFYGDHLIGYRPGIAEPQTDTKVTVVRSDGYGFAADSWDHMPIQVQNHGGGHAGYAWHNPGVNAAALVFRRDTTVPEWWDSAGRVLGAAIFRGMIFPFWGQISDIPPGYAVCDGNNGTPNLVGRTVIGTSNGYLAVGTVIGSDIAQTSGNGEHNHQGAVTPGGAHIHDGVTQGTSLSIDNMPAHTHTADGAVSTTNFGAWRDSTGGSQKMNIGSVTTSSTGSGTPHVHGFVTNATGDHIHGVHLDGHHAHTVDVRQPSVALLYIMKL